MAADSALTTPRAVNRRVLDTLIWITFDKPGVHCYPYAPDEVSYLRALHRHIFKFKVTITVHHDDREIEFHMMKNRLMALYGDQLELDHKSCEMMAKELHDKILEIYDCTNRMVNVEVSEDGECGAEICSFGQPSMPRPPLPTREFESQVGQQNFASQPVAQDGVTTVLQPMAAWPFPIGTVKDKGQEPGQEQS